MSSSATSIMNSFKNTRHFYKPTTKVRCEYPSAIRNIPVDTIKRLSESKELNVIEVQNEERYNVKIVFCPIVSRAGTDIGSVLSRLSDNEPTIVFVLHHTFDHEYHAPDSSRYGRNNLVMVDMLFHEDLGLLNCSKNDEAFRKARICLKKYAKYQLAENLMPLFALCAVLVVIYFFYIVNEDQTLGQTL